MNSINCLVGIPGLILVITFLVATSLLIMLVAQEKLKCRDWISSTLRHERDERYKYCVSNDVEGISKREAREIRNQINKILSDASKLCDEGKWEAALILYRKGLQLRPHSMACRAGEQRASFVIKNLLADKPNKDTDSTVVDNPQPQSSVASEVTETDKIFGTKTENPEFKELSKDLEFMKKAQQSEYFPKDGHFDTMLSNLNQLLKKKKPANKSQSHQPTMKGEKAEKEMLEAENWKKIIANLESVTDPSQLLISTTIQLSVLRESTMMDSKKVQVEGELYYLIMRAHIDLGDFDNAELYKQRIMRIVCDTEDDELGIRACYLEGRSFALKGNYTAAAKTWQDLLKRTTNPDRMAHLLHEVGRCFFKLEKLDSALAYGVLSLEAATEASNDTWVKNAAILLAQIATIRGNKAEAIDRYNTAEAAARRLGDQRALIYIICETQKLGKKPRRPKSSNTDLTSSPSTQTPVTLRRPKLLPNKYISVE